MLQQLGEGAHRFIFCVISLQVPVDWTVPTHIEGGSSSHLLPLETPSQTRLKCVSRFLSTV